VQHRILDRADPHLLAATRKFLASLRLQCLNEFVAQYCHRVGLLGNQKYRIE
jgi:hypothetical protein